MKWIFEKLDQLESLSSSWCWTALFWEPSTVGIVAPQLSLPGRCR